MRGRRARQKSTRSTSGAMKRSGSRRAGTRKQVWNEMSHLWPVVSQLGHALPALSPSAERRLAPTAPALAGRASAHTAECSPPRGPPPAPLQNPPLPAAPATARGHRAGGRAGENPMNTLTHIDQADEYRRLLALRAALETLADFLDDQ